MADAEEQPAETEDGAEKKKTPGKVLVLMIGAPVLLIIVGAALYFFVFSGGGKEDDYADADYAEEHADPKAKGGKGDHGGAKGNAEAPAPAPPESIPPEEAIFVEMPDILVNLNTSGTRPTYLKLKVALEVHKDTDQTQLDQTMPRVIDKFQVYLREMRVEDLSGSAGLFRLKEELLRRVNMATHPVRVYNVLFKEMLIQ